MLSELGTDGSGMAQSLPTETVIRRCVSWRIMVGWLVCDGSALYKVIWVVRPKEVGDTLSTIVKMEWSRSEFAEAATIEMIIKVTTVETVDILVHTLISESVPERDRPRYKCGKGVIEEGRSGRQTVHCYATPG